VAELTEKYGRENVQATLTAGKGGVFEVSIDGEQVYSKKAAGQFPRYGEIPQGIDAKLVNQ